MSSPFNKKKSCPTCPINSVAPLDKQNVEWLKVEIYSPIDYSLAYWSHRDNIFILFDFFIILENRQSVWGVLAKT